MATPEVLQRAQARARAKMALYKQGAYSLLLVLMLLGINTVTYRGYWWFWWPLLGLTLAWGMRAVQVLGRDHFDRLEQRLVKDELDKEERLRHIVDD